MFYFTCNESKIYEIYIYLRKIVKSIEMPPHDLSINYILFDLLNWEMIKKNNEKKIPKINKKMCSWFKHKS